MGLSTLTLIMMLGIELPRGPASGSAILHSDLDVGLSG